MVLTNLGSCSVLFAIEINPHISGPAQFKPMLFRVNCIMEVELQDVGRDWMSNLGSGKKSMKTPK